jgi:hypothetical protein
MIWVLLPDVFEPFGALVSVAGTVADRATRVEPLWFHLRRRGCGPLLDIVRKRGAGYLWRFLIK